MEKLKNMKKWIWIPILFVLLLIAAISVFALNSRISDESLFNLSERDVVLEIGESKKVELELEDEKINASKMEVTWVSSKPSVANVDKDGNITATTGGETRITAIVKYGGKQYTTSCVVTVKSADKEYSVYKIRWYTQNKDRNGYEMVEESHERLIGSSVELTIQDAKKNLPSNYVLNEEKSVFEGKVKENLNGCILEVYFDVAQITYSVDYYYESDTALGTYPTKETKMYTAYAFTKAEVTEQANKGFAINSSVKGTVMSKDSVVAGSKLKVFCDRIRSTVKVTYISGKPGATYNCIYGVGLVGAPQGVFEDSIEYKISTYINGKKKKATTELMKTVTSDTEVVFKLDGVGFDYSLSNGVSTITNNTTERKTPSYAMLNGKSNTLYLSATYQTTGSLSNTFGITLSSGEVSREIRFSNQGVVVMKDNTTDTKTSAYQNAGLYNSANTFVWAQNNHASKTTKASSVVKDMLKNKDGGNYQICWAVLEDVLYCSVEGETVLRLPLRYIESTWTGKQKYEIGISAYDEVAFDDDLKVTNVSLKTGKEAKAMLVTNKEIESSLTKNVAYDVLTGTYLPATNASAAYLYGAEATGDTGISSTVKWMNMDNTNSGMGVTVKVGDKSVQYVVQGENALVRCMKNHKWDNQYSTLTNSILNAAIPFKTDGTSEMTAFVKDGYFYVLFNKEEALCINMLSLFPDYTPESKVAVGIASWDAYNGLAQFSNVTQLDEAVIATLVDGVNVREWGYYSESIQADIYNFADGNFEKITSGEKEAVLFGSSATWQVEGTMHRYDDTISDLLMGFRIRVGKNTTLIVGRNEGFQKVITDKTTGKQIWSGDYRKYSDYTAGASSVYAFNTIASNKFFNKHNTDTRTQEYIDFKAVLYEDVLYVWFTDVNGNSGLCWRIPLTEEQFGGFEAGSDYEIALYMGSSDTDGSITNLDVKMGYQVTEQDEFMTVDNTTYSLEDTIATVESNVTRWDTFNNKTISGMLAEELDTKAVTTKTISAYLEGASTDIYLATTYGINTKTPKYFGIVLKDEKGNQREVLYNVMGVALQDTEGNSALGTLSRTAYNKIANTGAGNYIWVQNDGLNIKNTVNAMTNRGNTNLQYYDADWIITDGMIYGMLDGFVFFRMRVSELCEGWSETTRFQVGLAQFDSQSVSNQDVASIKNIEVYYGQTALSKMVKEEADNLTASGMTYEPFVGTYLPDSAKGLKTLYGTAVKGAQVLTATIDLLGGNSSTSSSGITVKSGDASAQILIEGTGTAVKVMTGGKSLDITPWLNPAVTELYNKNKCEMKAVVNKDVLYILFNNKLAGCVELVELLAGYTSGSDVQLGVCAYDSLNGLSAFSNLIFEGKEAVQGLSSALNKKHKWEVFTDSSNMTVTAVTATNGETITNTITATPTSDAETYVYATATNMPQKLTATVTQPSGSYNGITVALGNGDSNSVRFTIKGGQEKITIYNYGSLKGDKSDVHSVFIDLPDEVDITSPYNVTAIIRNKTLYVQYNNVTACSISLDKLFPEYQVGDSIKLGVYTMKAASSTSKFEHVSFEVGASVNDYNMSEAAMKIEYLVKKVNDGIGATISNNVVKKLNTNSGNGFAFFKGESKTWEVSGTITRTDSIWGKRFSPGFLVQKGNTTDGAKNNRLIVSASGIGIDIEGSIGISGWAASPITNAKYVLRSPSNAATMFSSGWAEGNKTKNTVAFKAIISNDVLYVWLGNDQASLEPAWRIPLTENIVRGNQTFKGNSAGTSYTFGLRINHEANGINGNISNLSVKLKDIDTAAVEAFEKAYQETRTGN